MHRSYANTMPFYRRVEHLRILASIGVLEPILCGSRGMTVNRMTGRLGGATGWEHGPCPFATPPVMSRGGGAAGGSPVSDRLQAQALKAQTPLLSMGICQAGHYLHLFLAHHPPLVCATLILLLLGLSGLGLGGFLLTHRTDLHSPDISQDWVSLRSFGQLALCPVNGTVTRKGRGSHVVGLLATLNFGDGPDRNKTQTFQAQVQGSPMGLKGSFAGKLVLVTARVTTERTPGICL